MKVSRAILALPAVLLLALLVSCAGHAPNPIAPITGTGNHLAQSTAYTESARSDVKTAIPLVPAEVSPLLKSADADLGKSLDHQAAAVADNDKARVAVDKLQQELAGEVAAREKLEHSWGHKFQVYVTWGFWILVGLVGVHVLVGLAAPFIPPPYGTIAAIVAKVVNPAGWVTWLIGHLQNRQAVGTQTTG